MEVGNRRGVCKNTPAQSTSPENGWRSSVVPVLSGQGKQRSSGEQEGAGFLVKLLATIWVKRPLVQIFEVVANIQMGTLNGGVFISFL